MMEKYLPGGSPAPLTADAILPPARILARGNFYLRGHRGTVDNGSIIAKLIFRCKKSGQFNELPGYGGEMFAEL